MFYLLGGFISDAITIIGSLGILLTGFAQFFIFNFLWLIFTGVAIITHFCEIVFKKLAGIDVIYLNGNPYKGASADGTGQDLVYAFISDSAVQDVFWSILALSLVLLFIFTIVALIKSEFTLELKASAKGPIIARSLKSLVNFIAVPAIAIISIIGTNFLTKTIYDMFGGADSSIVGKCFVLGGYNANRARKSEDFYDQLKNGRYSSDESDTIFDEGTTNPFKDAGSKEEMAKLVDQYFMDHASFDDLSYRDLKFVEKLRDFRDGYSSYLNTIALFAGVPDNGNFYYTNVRAVNFYYDIAEYDYILGIGSMIVMAWTLLSVALVLLKRVFEMTILFLLAPVMTAIAPLDGGQAEKKWRQEFMKRLLAVVGPIFAINMYFLLVPLFENISLFNSLGDAWSQSKSSSFFISGTMLGAAVTDVSGFLFQFINRFDMFFQIVCILTGLSILKSASAILSNLLGIDDLIKSGGENMKKAVDSGKKAWGLANSIQGVALKGTAFLGRSLYGGLQGLTNKEGRLLKKEEKAKKELEDAKANGADNDTITAMQLRYNNAVDATQEYENKKSGHKHSGGSLRAEAHGKFFEDKKAKKAEIDAIKESMKNATDDEEKAKLQKKLIEEREKYDTEFGGDDEDKTRQLARAAGEKAIGADKIKEKGQKRATGMFSAFYKGYNNEYGEDSDKNNLLGGWANKVDSLAKKVKVPILGKRLQKSTESIAKRLNISGDTGIRRFNDMFAGIMGDGGGGDLWKINFNVNARAGLFEGFPESKQREQNIQQMMLSKARDKYTKDEADKNLKEDEMKNLARYFAEQNNDPKYARKLEERKKAEESGDRIKVAKIDKDIENMNASMGYNKMARDALNKGVANDPNFRAFRERIKDRAYSDTLSKENKESQDARVMAEKYGSKPQKTELTGDSASKIYEAIKNALNDNKVKVDASALTEAITNMQTEFSKIATDIQEAVKKLTGEKTDLNN